jgi:hypothetical protein
MNVPILARNLSHHAAKRPAIQFSKSLTRNNRSYIAVFILPAADLSTDNGSIVKFIHKNGVVENSVIYKTQAQTTAEDRTNLDEDWAKV